MPQLAALGLTIAVELPWWVLGLAGLRLTGAGRAALLGIAVNLLTHPVLWWLLTPRPAVTHLAAGELAVCAVEAALAFLWVRREPALLLVVSAGANATSAAIGLLLS